MNHPSRKKPRTKPVTAGDYRRERDYWKRRATDRQRQLDAAENRNDRLTGDAAAARASLDYFRDELQKICLHDRITNRFSGQPYCERCKRLLELTERTDPS